MKNRNENFSNNDVTLIGPGVILEGKLESKGNVRIDGKVKGNIHAKGNITIGENGEIEGEVTSMRITVGGKISGKVIAEEKIILESKSVLVGDLFTKILEVQAGAKFDGNSKMSSTESTIKNSKMPSFEK